VQTTGLKAAGEVLISEASDPSLVACTYCTMTSADSYQWTSDEDMFADMERGVASINKKAEVEGDGSAEKAEAEGCDWAADLDSNKDGKAEVEQVRTELGVNKARVNIEDMDQEEDLVRNLCRFLPLASLVSLHSASHRLGRVMDKVLKDRIDSEIRRVIDVMGHINDKVQSDINNMELHIKQTAEHYYCDIQGYYHDNYMWELREFKDEVNKLEDDRWEIRGKIEDLQKPECKLTAKAKMLVLKDKEDAVARVTTNFEVLKTKYKKDAM
jgi:hypothetical protein